MRRELKPKRRYIKAATKTAAALLAKGDISYDDAKKMTEKQFLALWEWDHNIPHASGGDDSFLNLTPMLKDHHLDKTKRDAKDMAKTRRIHRDDGRWLMFMPMLRSNPKTITPRRWPKRRFINRPK